MSRKRVSWILDSGVYQLIRSRSFVNNCTYSSVIEEAVILTSYLQLTCPKEYSKAIVALQSGNILSKEMSTVLLNACCEEQNNKNEYPRDDSDLKSVENNKCDRDCEIPKRGQRK